MPKYDPTEEINKRAFGSLYEKHKKLQRAAQTGLTKGVNWATTPFEALVEKGKEADTRRARQFDIPEDYELPKGGSEFVAENITPLDIALAAAPGIKRLAQMESVGEALKFSNPLRSEVGAVGKDISKAAKAAEPKISRKGGLLFDNDLAGATPRNIGTNPRAQGTSPRQTQLAKEVKESFQPGKIKKLEGLLTSGESDLVHGEVPSIDIIPSKAETIRKPPSSIAKIEIEGGFTGQHSPKTGTFRLQGPQGEVVSGKIHPDHIEFISIGKGKAKNSKSAQDAIRALAAKEGKPVYSTSTNLSSSGGEFRSRMMERGDLVETDKGLLWKGTGETSPTKNQSNLAKQQLSVTKSPTPKAASTPPGKTTKPQQLPSNPPAPKGGSNLPPSQPPNTPSGNVPPSGTPPNPTGGPTQPSRRKATLWQNLLGTPKSLKSVMDLPALRQAVVPSLTHPIDIGIPAVKAGLKSQFGTEKMYEDVLGDIASRPFHDVYGKYGMQIPDVGVRQEYPAAWPEQLEEALGIAGPVTRSERGYDATLKTARANLADPLIQKAIDKYSNVQGPGFGNLGAVPQSTMEGLANYVNDFTGYGTLGPAEKSADILAAPFYSPRMLTSRAQMLNPWNYLGGKRWGDIGKSAARKDMSKFAGGTAAGLGLADYLAGDKFNVETDPRSSDFMSPKIEDTTFDLMGGMRPMINAGARLATGEAKSSKDDQNIYPVNMGSTLRRFVRSKLGPGIPTMAADYTGILSEPKQEGKDFIGQPINRSFQSGPFEDVPYLPWLANQVTPMYPSDVTEAFEQSGPEAGIPAAIAGILGVGSTSYDRTPNKKKRYQKKPMKVRN